MCDSNTGLPFLMAVFPIYLAAGLAGGLVNGVNPPDGCPDPSCRSVSVDALTGLGASVAVLLLVVNMMEGFTGCVEPKTYLGFWSIGMISGFMGKRFMNMMSEVLGSKFGAISRQMDQIAVQNKAAPLMVTAGDAYSSKRYDRALAYYNRVLQIDPDDLEAKVGKAKSMYYTAGEDQGRLNEALSILNEVLEETPDNDHALYHKAAILLKLSPGDSKTPLDILEKADRINPAIGRGAQKDDRFRALHGDSRFRALEQ